MATTRITRTKVGTTPVVVRVADEARLSAIVKVEGTVYFLDATGTPAAKTSADGIRWATADGPIPDSIPATDALYAVTPAGDATVSVWEVLE